MLLEVDTVIYRNILIMGITIDLVPHLRKQIYVTEIS